MFSGKSERLIARLREAQRRGLRVRAFKHVIDDRYDADHLITHTQDRFEATRAADAAAIERGAGDAEVIGIDEAHFFGAALVDVVRRLTAAGRRVIVVGIDRNAWGLPFEPMPALAAMADEVVQASAPCRGCGAPARYSQRMVPVMSDCMVGGAESYEPRCVAHFQPLPGPAESA